MSKRNYTRELRRAAEQGAKIVCSMAPFEGVEVTYAPRMKGDPQPWRPEQNGHMPDVEYRYSGRECHALVTLTTGRSEIDVEPDGDFTPDRVSGVVRAVRPRTP